MHLSAWITICLIASVSSWIGFLYGVIVAQLFVDESMRQPISWVPSFAFNNHFRLRFLQVLAPDHASMHLTPFVVALVASIGAILVARAAPTLFAPFRVGSDRHQNSPRRAWREAVRLGRPPAWILLALAFVLGFVGPWVCMLIDIFRFHLTWQQMFATPTPRSLVFEITIGSLSVLDVLWIITTVFLIVFTAVVLTARRAILRDRHLWGNGHWCLHCGYDCGSAPSFSPGTPRPACPECGKPRAL